MKSSCESPAESAREHAAMKKMGYKVKPNKSVALKNSGKMSGGKKA